MYEIRQYLDLANDWLHLHPFVAGVAMALMGIAAAFLIDKIFTNIFKKLTKKTKSNIDDLIVEQLHRPIEAAVLLLAAIIILQEFFGAETWSQLLIKLIKTLFTLVYSWVLWRVSRTILDHFMAVSKNRRVGQLLPLFKNIIVAMIIIHGSYLLLDLWGINVTPLLASAGIVTAAVALASKDTLSNFFGGISVFVDRPYVIGDYIVLGSGERGEVVNIGMRSTRILTRDDVLISVPNSMMSNQMITNQSGQVPRYRLRIRIGVSYDNHPDEIEAALIESLSGVKPVIWQPPPRVRFREFGDSALIFELLAWIAMPADRGRVVHEINRNIYYKFKEEEIGIPYPQRVVYLHQPKDATLEANTEDQ